MSREFRLYLDDILEAIARIREYLMGMGQDAFAQDRRTQDAVIRNLEIIGEAVRQIPDEVRQRAPAVEWRNVCGLRDVLIHRYFGVNMKIVWDIATKELDTLEVEVRKLSSGNTVS